MIDVNSAEYERRYAQDMKAFAAYDFCRDLGVDLVTDSIGRWLWKRSIGASVIVSASTYEDKGDAALDCMQFYATPTR